MLPKVIGSPAGFLGFAMCHHSMIRLAAGASGFLTLTQAAKLHKLPSLPNRDNGND
jgi:hypothetical protein